MFLNEPLINTSIFDSTKNNLLEISVQTGNAAIDDYFKGNISEEDAYKNFYQYVNETYPAIVTPWDN